MQFGIYYGVAHPSIGDQLKEQGIEIENPDRYEKDRKAIHQLTVRGILTWSESDAAFKRLHKAITTQVKKSLKVKASPELKKG